MLDAVYNRIAFIIFPLDPPPLTLNLLLATAGRSLLPRTVNVTEASLLVIALSPPPSCWLSLLPTHSITLSTSSFHHSQPTFPTSNCPLFLNNHTLYCCRPFHQQPVSCDTLFSAYRTDLLQSHVNSSCILPAASTHASFALSAVTTLVTKSLDLICARHPSHHNATTLLAVIIQNPTS